MSQNLTERINKNGKEAYLEAWRLGSKTDFVHVRRGCRSPKQNSRAAAPWTQGESRPHDVSSAVPKNNFIRQYANSEVALYQFTLKC